MIKQVAYLSLHTSPLLQPGQGDAGGMNVYIHELAQTMADRGIEVDVFTRATSADLEPIVQVTPNYRVIHIPAGPLHPVPIAGLTDCVFEFAEAVIDWSKANHRNYDLVHSHYWLSGWAGLMVKRILDLPLANSFHTLGRVKDATRRDDEPASAVVRIAAEHEVIAGSDCVIGSTPYEAEDLLDHYGADPARLCVSPPGIDHDTFRPGDRPRARAELGLGENGPLLLFVGRIQALKAPDVAVEAFALVREKLDDARLVIVGGASGPGGRAELARLHAMVDGLGLRDAVVFFEPQPHDDLVTFYRAADAVILPSRSETFGLVAVEAQACGVPVVAAQAGGLSYAVADDESGFLVNPGSPENFATRILEIFTDDELAERLSKGALDYADQFSWQATADRLLELYAGITS